MTTSRLGPLNLTLAEVPAPETHTIYRRKSTGRAITLRTTPAFAARFANVPFEHLKDAGRVVMQLRDDEIFETVPRAGGAVAVTSPSLTGAP